MSIMHAVRMLEDQDGAHDHIHVHTYKAGETYSRESEPPISADLMEGFVARGQAVEVDAAGNPVGTPADARAKKAAWVAEVAALMGEPMPAASESVPESAPEGDSDAAEAEPATDSGAASDAPGEPVEASQNDDPSEDSGPARRGRR